MLRASRQRTLALLAAFEAALGPDLAVPCRPQFNPPLWEMGHIGWFQEYWIGRNLQRTLGIACDPLGDRAASRLAGADALYDSSHVPHDARWSLPLPGLPATRDYLEAVLEGTLALLQQAPPDDAALYFYRLVLFHEDMHAEAATYMAQALGVPLGDGLVPEPVHSALEAAQALQVQACDWQQGWSGPGFAFDNELAPRIVRLPAFAIDSQPVPWRQFLAFADAGGYADARWWTQPAWQWCCAHSNKVPRYLRRAGAGWETQRFGRWEALNLDAPAVHLTAFEAEAWCRWAGRCLPTEAQWECAAMTLPGFAWGAVWEWTATPFEALPGFMPHPYRDYSAPWFGSRPVLKGASVATSPRMTHPRYRNFFTPERNDIHAGFRSCRAVPVG
jgi:ergothioneine biosynthesis protein EgtB